MRNLAGDELIARYGRYEQAESQGHQQVERRDRRQNERRAFERDMEQEASGRCCQKQTNHPKQEIGQSLADQDLARSDRCYKKRLQGALFPFARRHKGGEQRSRERHNEYDQSRHQKVMAVHSLIEPHPGLEPGRSYGRGGLTYRPLISPLLERALGIALNEAKKALRYKKPKPKHEDKPQPGMAA